MRWMVRELVVPPGYGAADLLRAAAGRLRVPAGRVTLVRILRESLDARSFRPQPVRIVNALFDVNAPCDPAQLKNVEPADLPDCAGGWSAPAGTGGRERPVVIGAGPAGLFAAYTLAAAGRQPLLLEQGRPVRERCRAVGAFWGKGILDPYNNVLCGEGGAGAFSDGKLTARSKDQVGRDFVLARLVECGAPPGILYEAEAHLGSDRLARIIPVLRDAIIALGGEVRFGVRVTGFCTEGKALAGVQLVDGVLPCRCCVLAAGHSARTMYRALAAAGAVLEAKGFAVGVRVELPQRLVNRSQLGRFAGHPAVGPASFRLTHRGQCHTFCMCPGGSVIACADTPGLLCTNGMSLSRRSGGFANAAFLVPLPPLEQVNGSPSGPSGVCAGLDYLGRVEAEAFRCGGGDYALPATTLAGLNGADIALPERRSCRRARRADFQEFLPADILQTLRAALPEMVRTLGNPAPEEVVLYGPETRSTSPVRLVRDPQTYEAAGLAGLYPAGEGAGYAGGIVSSAIDGFRAAEALLRAPV